MIKRVIKWIFEGICILLLIPFVFALALQIKDIRLWALAQTSAILQRYTTLELQIDDFHLSPFFRLNIPKATIRTEQGVVAEVEEATLNWNPFSLLHGEILWSELLIKRLSICNLPTCSKGTASEPSFSPINFSEISFFPYSLELAYFQVDRLELSSTLINTQSPAETLPIALHGSFFCNPSQGETSLAITFQDQEYADSHTRALLTTRMNNQELEAYLQVIEGSHGILTAHIPFALSGGANVHMKGPLEAWEALIWDNRNSSFKPPINGTLDITYHLDDSVGRLPPGDGRLQLAFLLMGRQELQIKAFLFEQAPFAFSGTMQLDLPSLSTHSAQLHLEIEDMELISDIARGEINIDAILQGPITMPNMSITAWSPILGVSTHLLKDCQVTWSGGAAQENIEGTLVGQCSIAGHPLNARGEFLWARESGLTISPFILQSSFGTIQANLTLAESFEHLQGTIEAHLDQLEHVSSFFSPELRIDGQADVTAQISWQADEDAFIQIEGALREIILDHGSFEKAEIAMTLQGMLTDPTGTIAIQSENIRWEEWQFDHLNLSTEYHSSYGLQPFKIAAKSKGPLAADLEAGGLWEEQGESYHLALHHLSGFIEQEQIALQTPWSFIWHPSFWKGTALELNIGKESAVQLFLEATRQELNCYWVAKRIPLDWLARASVEVPFTGYFDVQGGLTGSAASPKAKTKFNFTAIPKLEHGQHLTPLTGEIKTTCDYNQLRIKGQFKGIGIEEANFAGEFPIRWQLMPFDFKTFPTTPIHAGLSLKSDLTAIFDLLSTPDTTLRGDILAQMEVTGSLETPIVQGKIDIQNGHFENIKSGAVLEGMQAHLEAQGRDIEVQHVSGRDLFGGNFAGKGKLYLDEAFQLLYTVNFQLNNLHLVNLDFAKAGFNGNLQLKGDLDEASLTGSVATQFAEVSLRDDIPEAADTVEVTYINLNPGEQAPTYKGIATKSIWPIHLDFQLNAPQVQVHGSGLTSLWKAKVQVQGIDDAPLLFGEASVRSGEYLLRGKVFTFKQGTVTFAGDPEKKTALYLVATHDINDTLVEVILRGPISNPGISFRSSPPMSQQEILSWILFGRGVTEINALQGAQLHRSITTLKEARREAAKGPNVLSAVQDSLGIDRLDIQRTPNPNGDQVSLQVGKYFSNGLFFSLNRNFTNNTNSLSIEAKLMQNLKLQAEISDTEDDQLMLKWKRDY